MNRRIQLSKSPATDPNTHAGAPTHFQPQPKQKRLPGLRTPLANGADYTNEPENLKKKTTKNTHTYTTFGIPAMRLEEARVGRRPRHLAA